MHNEDRRDFSFTRVGSRVLVEREMDLYCCLALLGLFWSLAFVSLVSEKPNEHPTISEEELIFIEKSLEDVRGLYGKKDGSGEETIPWKAIVLSLPVWAICWAHFARGWTFYLLLTNQPAFLQAFGFGVTENGTLGSFPHILKVLVALSSGFIADFLRWNLLWSTTNVRKTMTCAGNNTTLLIQTDRSIISLFIKDI